MVEKLISFVCVHMSVCAPMCLCYCVCELTMFNVTSLHMNSVLGNFVVEWFFIEP